MSESPRSSAPSTPADDHPPRLGHRRTDSVAIEGEDYFMSLARFASGETERLPGTPRSIAARNISFNTKLQFHDTWPSGEYDRRGEVATCNRLTPMLAQQIKEELNTFKMVCVSFPCPHVTSNEFIRKWRSMSSLKYTRTSSRVLCVHLAQLDGYYLPSHMVARSTRGHLYT